MRGKSILRPTAAVLALAVLAACAGNGPVQAPAQVVEPAIVVEPVSAVAAGDVNLRAMLAFYRKARGMSRAELKAEREALADKVDEPLQALKLAMLLGHERADLARALGLLDGIARSDSSQALALQPLARLLSDQYAERLKLEVQIERLGTSIRASKRRAAELQSKIDALADIERSLPGRPAPALPDPGGAR